MASVVSFHHYICHLDLSSLPRVVKIYSGVYFQGSVYEVSGSECCLSTGDLIKIVDVQLQNITCKNVNDGHTFELPLNFKGLFEPSQDPPHRKPKKLFPSANSLSRASYKQKLYTLQEILQSEALWQKRLKCAEIGSSEFEIYPVYKVEAIMHYRNDVVKINSMLDVEVIDITEESQHIHFIKPLMLSQVLTMDKVLPVEAEVLGAPVSPPVFQSDWMSYLYKGCRIHIHNQASSWKILATSRKSKGHTGHFLISSNYKGRFRQCPRQFSSTSELVPALATTKKLQVVVTKDYESSDDDFPLLSIGDRLELQTLVRARSPSATDTLVCYRDNGDEDKELIHLPLFLEAGFVEDVRDKRKYTLAEAVEHLRLPCEVKLVSGDGAFDVLSTVSVLTLEAQIKEDFFTASLANEPGLTFEIPPKWLDISLFFTGRPVRATPPSNIPSVEELTESFYYDLLKQLPNNAAAPPRPPKRMNSTLEKRHQKTTEGKTAGETFKRQFSTSQNSRFLGPKSRSASHLPLINPNEYTIEYRPEKLQTPTIPCKPTAFHDDSDHDYEEINEEVKGIVHKMGRASIKH
ncbi:protein THEMIS2 [Anolis carolinensis]|uniref:Thymocyte selection associated family member 2 n=1 Tax=Anolis carolinensis TaxID=28377 RepID=H9GRQ6_ANOCA|nr:PREDICTED: protein THEMIS2 [Anolis carolinensis]|eukprot:XP_003228914.1 PREDICTED: protein THEMIS2 [Anolis carolinensis]